MKERERDKKGGRKRGRLEERKKSERKEESSDYSCSPVTKNELLTAAKYRAIKFTIVPYSSYLDPSVPFHLFGAFKQTSSRSSSSIEPRKTKNERKFPSLSPLPIFRPRESQFPEGSSSFFLTPFLSTFLHPIYPIFTLPRPLV